MAQGQQLQQQQKRQQLASVCKVKVQHLGVKRGRGLVATQHIRRGEGFMSTGWRLRVEAQWGLNKMARCPVEKTDVMLSFARLSAARAQGVGLVGAGQCVAQVLFEVVYRSRELEAAMTPYKRFHSAPWESLAKREGPPGFQGAPHGAPRETAARGKQQRQDETESFGLAETEERESTETAEGRRHLLEASLRLLREALEPTAQKHQVFTNAEHDELFGLDFFSRLVGTFSLVCLDVEFDHPLNNRLNDLVPKWRQRLQQPSRQTPGGNNDVDEETKGTRLLIQLLSEVSSLTCANNKALDMQVEKKTEETRGGRPEGGPFLPFLGWGLFAFGSMTNHSCWPNAESDFPLPRPSLEVRALRPIQEGEEVVVSYIDETLPLHDRQRLLNEGLHALRITSFAARASDASSSNSNSSSSSRDMSTPPIISLRLLTGFWAIRSKKQQQQQQQQQLQQQQQEQQQ
ncbi:hypothetical protein Emag_006344 [Eimeria magna]